MFRLFNTTRKAILFASCFVFVLFAVALTLSVKINSQQRHALNQKDKDALLEQIEKSVEQPLRIIENDDSPLRIVEAKVKEISGADFTKLTGKTTDLVAVSSVPEVKLVNSSEKTITKFVFAIRDPKTKTTRGFVQADISIAPGETYIIMPQHFVEPEKLTVRGEDGKPRQKLIQRKMDSERYWLDFAGRSDIFVALGIVYFKDGSDWKIKTGGEIQ